MNIDFRAFYAEERRKSREDVDVFISLLRKSRDRIQIAMEPYCLVLSVLLSRIERRT